MPVFEWYLWPAGFWFEAHDIFFARGWRFEMAGNSVRVNGDASITEGQAREVAEAYLNTFREHIVSAFPGLLTTAEYEARTSAPHGAVIEVQGASPDEIERLSRALAAARERVMDLRGESEGVRRAYAYIQESREKEDSPLVRLYKAFEAIRAAAGGGDQLRAKVAVAKKEISNFTRVANETTRDERHAPGDGEAVVPTTPEELEQARTFINELAEAYAMLPDSQR